MNAALGFLSGTEFDQNGRYVLEYLNFDANDWDCIHNVIQWAFPTRTVSAYNSHAPVLPDTFTPHPGQQQMVSDLFVAYFSSLGVFVKTATMPDRVVSLQVIPVPPRPWWIKKGDHNYKRFTRIIECLKAFHLTQMAEDLHDWLVFDFAVQYHEYVDANTVAFWTATWQDKRHLLRD